MPQGLRARFWDEARGLLEGSLAWPERFAQLETLIGGYGAGWDLVHAPPRRDSSSDPHAICRPLPDAVVGYRAFLIPWELGVETLIHGHPSVMFVFPISARLDAVDYTMVDGRPERSGSRSYGPGEPMVGWADNDRHDNFMHRLMCTHAGWSLHIYSDWGGRGVRFDAQGNPVTPTSRPEDV